MYIYVFNPKQQTRFAIKMFTTNAESKRVNLVSEYFKKAYDNDQKVVYVNALVPSEILLTFGVVPFNLGAVGGVFAQAKASTALINIAEQHYFSSDLCSTSRCLIGAAYVNAMPTPDFLILTSGPCDVDSHLIHTLSQIYDKNWFLLDIPMYYDDQEEATNYLESQISDLIAAMEEALQIPFDYNKLDSVISLTNQTLAFVQKINELAKNIPSSLSVVETIDIVSSLHLLGSKELAEIYREKYQELLDREQSLNVGTDRKPRVFWHWLRPYYTNEIFEHLTNNCKLDILSEYDVMGINYYGWQPFNSEKPLRVMARRMLYAANNYSITNHRFIRQVPVKIKEYSIDGAISFSPRGCRHLVSLNYMLRDIFNSNSIPFLEIDCDCIDNRDYSFSQIQTRLDAFSELLYGRMV